MKIAVITSGILPVPAVQGGAVENLVDFYLEYNKIHKLHDITIYSIYDKKVNEFISAHSNNHYKYVNTNSLIAKIRRKIFQYIHKNGYYNNYIEYFFYQVMQDIKKQSFDLIISENRPGYVIKLSQVTRAKIILHLHNDLLNRKTEEAHKIFNKCSLIIAVSNYIKHRVESIDVTSKIDVVHNGIDVENFQKRIPANRKQFGFTTDDFIVVFSGRIIKEKGIKELLEAFILLRKYPQIKLLIIGGSFFGNDLQENEFMKEIHQIALPLKQRIIFTGFKSYSEIPRLLSMSDIAIIPSIWEEPFGLTVVEAMAVGLPLIVTNSGGISEVVNPECAIILDNDEHLVDQIAQNILMLYRDKNKRNIMSLQGKQHSNLFHKEKYAIDFFSKIAQIL